MITTTTTRRPDSDNCRGADDHQEGPLMTATHTSYARTPWWEHTTTTTEPCDEQPTTTSTPASTTTSTAPEQPTTTVNPPDVDARFEITPPNTEFDPFASLEGPPTSIHVAVSTPLPPVDAVVLAPPVSYAAPTLPHTGSETLATAGIGGLLVAVGLICTALAARTRKAHR